jgi:hypothetical protein
MLQTEQTGSLESSISDLWNIGLTNKERADSLIEAPRPPRVPRRLAIFTRFCKAASSAEGWVDYIK